jgi:4-hydroxybenzoate polyprenyltransferase
MKGHATYLHSITLLRIPFSLLLLPVFLLALSQTEFIDPYTTLATFVILHLLVYPASNGYNSYEDRDTGSIGGLQHPPSPSLQLYYLTLMMDIMAVLLSYILVGQLFSVCILVYIMASRAYSSRYVRLKKYPVTGFFTVVFFQGAFTYYMVWIGIRGIIREMPDPLVMAACSCQIAAFYPLTQIYQHEADKANGDTTISMLLGYRGTFVFSFIMFLLAGLCYFFYFSSQDRMTDFALLLLFLSPALLNFIKWFLQVYKAIENADYQRTMRMSAIGALCMCLFFIAIILRGH